MAADRLSHYDQRSWRLSGSGYTLQDLNRRFGQRFAVYWRVKPA